MAQFHKLIDELDVSLIRNRNETIVAECMREELAADPTIQFSKKMLMDVYAYALNNLAPRYAHRGTIVLGNRPPKDDIAEIVHEAFRLVKYNPKD